ncbi:MAG: NADP-dependent malic enzyme, partial [Dictyoglomi bacterium]|nr:NADP-dependent malic enzyme [Dictyoglomota bacterium]
MSNNIHRDLALGIHRAYKGKVSITPKIPHITYEDFAYLYTPYVADACRTIANDKSEKYNLTSVGNTIAIVTNGSRILGLGNIGPEAGHPVMEGKSLLFKVLGGVDAYPLSINAPSYKEIVAFVNALKPSVSGINLEDISQPDAFLAWQALQNIDIPVFHDDMEGTAIVLMAGLINASRVVGKTIEKMKVVFVGSGSAGLGFALLWSDMNLPTENIIFIDRKGVISLDRSDIRENPVKSQIANLSSGQGHTLDEVVDGADAIIGASSPGAIRLEHIKKMADKPIVFAVSNPVPEIYPEDAIKAGAYITATGRSDFSNQLNNSLVFPSLFRGTLSARANKITASMKKEAVYALADEVKKPRPDRIIPR